MQKTMTDEERSDERPSMEPTRTWQVPALRTVLMRDAERLVHAIGKASADYCSALLAHDAMRQARDLARARVMDSLIGEINPRTGKAHSATSAEVAAREDTSVQAAEVRCLQAETRLVMARAAQLQAELTARLAVAACEHHTRET